MPNVNVYNQDGSLAGEIALNDAVFGIEVNTSAIHQVVVAHNAAARQGTQSALFRGEVSGGGIKPWRQKGTGRARQGSTRAPQWRHGGVVFAPKPREYDKKVNKKIKARILQQVKDIFGGQLFEMMFGGAGLNREVEDFLRHIGFPLAVGYGTTETAPLITYSDYRDFVRGTCGRVVDNMEIRIASPDPANVPGEILTRGMNVMLGYYKNPEASHAVLDKDGWFHTGDLATIDAEGHVFIRGRIKNMLLSANGQNIYPEEIENKLNSMMMVNESVIIQRDNACRARMARHLAQGGFAVGQAHMPMLNADNLAGENDFPIQILFRQLLVVYHGQCPPQ